jgi:hypothetical protein
MRQSDPSGLNARVAAPAGAARSVHFGEGGCQRTATLTDELPQRALRGCFASSRWWREYPGPRWVRTASGTAGHRRAPTVNLGMRKRRSDAYRRSDLGRRRKLSLGSNPTSAGTPTDLLIRASPSSRTGATYRRELRTSSQRSAQISRTVSDCHMTTASATRPATTRRSSQGQAPVGPSPFRSCSIDSPSSSKAADRV